MNLFSFVFLCFVCLHFTFCQNRIVPSLVAQTIKRLSTIQETWLDHWVRKIYWRRKWQSTPVLLPGKSHGQRSLVSYSLWGRKELDTTEQLHFHGSSLSFVLLCSLLRQHHLNTRVFPGGSVVKNLPSIQETRVQSLGQEDPLEEGMATYSSILAWRIPWTGEPGGLQSRGVAKSRTRLKRINTHAPVC